MTNVSFNQLKINTFHPTSIGLGKITSTRINQARCTVLAYEHTLAKNKAEYFNVSWAFQPIGEYVMQLTG